MCPPSEHPVVRVIEEIDPDETMSSVLRRMVMFKQAGVREYWAVDAFEQQIHVYSLHREGASSSAKRPSDWERTEAEFFAPVDDLAELLSPPRRSASQPGEG